MSAKSKNTSAKREAKGGAALDRPFAPDVLRRADEIAKRYQVVIWPEEGEYYGRGVEMPGVMADGRTPAACYAAVYDALKFAVATVLEQGQTPPPAAVEGQRTEQVNIRLTAEERLQLEAAAKQRGYRGLADFFRAAALAMANAPVGGPADVAAGVDLLVRDPGLARLKYTNRSLSAEDEAELKRLGYIRAKKGAAVKVTGRRGAIVIIDSANAEILPLPEAPDLQ